MVLLDIPSFFSAGVNLSDSLSEYDWMQTLEKEFWKLLNFAVTGEGQET